MVTVALSLAVVGIWVINSNQAFGPYTQIGGWLFLGMAGMAVLGLFATPNTITAWDTGAEGEVRTARFMEPLTAEGFRIIHDRKMPGAKSNIDHIVVGPPGVFIVETKSYKGRLRIRGSEIYVNGRRSTLIAHQALREAVAVQSALVSELDARDLRVKPILCFHRTSLPWFKSEFGGIPIVSGKDLVKHLRKSTPILTAADVQGFASLIEARLKPAYLPPMLGPTLDHEASPAADLVSGQPSA